MSETLEESIVQAEAVELGAGGQETSRCVERGNDAGPAEPDHLFHDRHG